MHEIEDKTDKCRRVDWQLAPTSRRNSVPQTLCLITRQQVSLKRRCSLPDHTASHRVCCLYRLSSENLKSHFPCLIPPFSAASVVQWLACWPLVPKIAGSNTAEAVGFLGRKNPQHAFLRRGSKAVCPMSQICGMLKTPGNYVEVGFSGEICRPFLAHFRSSLSEGSHVA